MLGLHLVLVTTTHAVYIIIPSKTNKIGDTKYKIYHVLNLVVWTHAYYANFNFHVGFTWISQPM